MRFQCVNNNCSSYVKGNYCKIHNEQEEIYINYPRDHMLCRLYNQHHIPVNECPEVIEISFSITPREVTNAILELEV